jgi:transposase
MGRKRKPMGRPVKLTPEVQEDICAAIRAGNYIEPSAIRAGVSKSTLYSWLKKGKTEADRVDRAVAVGRRAKVTAKLKPYVDFLDAVKKAEAEAEARDVAIISKAAMTQWQAAAWRLERKHYDRWGRRQALEHSGPQGKPVKVQRVRIGDDVVEF